MANRLSERALRPSRRTWLESVRPLISAHVGDESLLEKRYNELIEASARLFQVKGFDRTTIDDIAERLEISVGAIYRYVKRKEDILLLTLARTLWRFQDLVHDPSREDEEPEQRLRDLMRAYYRIIADDVPSSLLAYRESYVLEGEGLQLIQRLELETKRVFEEILEEGIRRGSFGACRVDVVAYDIVMLGHMWALKRWYLGKVVALDDYIEEQTEFILRAIRSHSR